MSISSNGQTATRTGALETTPRVDVKQPTARIPNTPLAASTVSFLLGSVFTFGALGFLTTPWWMPYQLGFYLASWAAFHWGEFAVTAGWNREKCSIDCRSSLYTSLIYDPDDVQLSYLTTAPCITLRIV